MTEAYPLAWPDGWARTPTHQRKRISKFGSNFARSRDLLLHEFRLMGVPSHSVVISSWLPLRRDGLPYADQARRPLEDPGVAVYFTLRGRQMVMARDVYGTPFDNLHSLKIAIEHLRGLERHGGATMMERAFEGFAALPDQPGWRVVLGFKRGDVVSVADAEKRYRDGAKLCHADVAGGNHDAMVKLNAAITQARSELGT